MPTPQNGQTHSNNSSQFPDELFQCIRPFCGVGALRVKVPTKLRLGLNHFPEHKLKHH